MRVSVDSQVVTDPRFKKLGRALGMSWHEALGRAYVVWLESYQRRQPVLTIEDIDALAERDGFGVAMVRAELAMHVSDDRVRIRGVEARIEFLIGQKERSVRGVAARAASGRVSGTRSNQVSDRPERARAEHQDERRTDAGRQPNGQPIGSPFGEPNGQPSGEPNGQPIGEPFGQPIFSGSGSGSGKESEREKESLRLPRASEAPPALRASLSQIPSGFVPDFGDPESARIVASARARGVDVEREIEKFRQHCKSKSMLRSDWNAAALEWIIRANPDPNGHAVAPIPEPSRRQASGIPAPSVTRSQAEIDELKRMASAVASSLDVAPTKPDIAIVFDRERFDDGDHEGDPPCND